MQSLHSEFGKKGVTIIGVDLYENGEPPVIAVKRYATEHGYSYAFTTNNDSFGRKLGVESLPTVVVLDKKGFVRYGRAGYSEMSHDELAKVVRGLVAEKG